MTLGGEMEKWEHDPRTKQQIKNALYDFVYAPVDRQFKERLDAIIIKNTLMGGYAHRHFIYKGEVYNIEVTPAPLKKNKLLAALRAPMDDYLVDKHELNSVELPFVLGFINQVLNASPDLTDYMRIFPESVHYPLNQLLSTCPCRTTTLNEDRVAALMARNQEPINMIKRRLVTNLLI
jgi:hypothetical protein